MSDEGRNETDSLLEELEKKIKREYEQATVEMQNKLDDYLRRFKIKDEIKQEAVKQGTITQEEYNGWRLGQIMISQRWAEMRDTLAEDLVHVDDIAMSIVRGYMPEVYAINHNYGTFEVEKGSFIDTSYTLYDRSTVERLFRDNPNLLPDPRVNIPKDLIWNKQKVTSAIMQGVLQGESIDGIAARLRSVTDMDYKSAVRNARTATTGAQNAGRVDSYIRAKGLGIDLEQEWLATLDGRTRHSHRQLDGERIEVGKKFSNGCRFPGDPQGPSWEIYNCRCTLVPAIKGIDQSDAERNSKLGSMTYEEWKHEHDKPVEVRVPDLQSQIGTATSVQEINDIMNNQGWFRILNYVNKDGTKGVSMADLTGVDLESAKSIASSYQQIYERYPQLIGKFDAPNAHPVGMKDNTYAWCYIRDHGKVEVNPKQYSNWGSILKKYEEDVVAKWHPQGTTAESIVIHELGHAVDGLLAREGILGGYTSSGEFRYASSSLKTTIMKRAAKLDENVAFDMDWNPWWAVRDNVSEYAAKNSREWFAECFAEYITSANPRIIATEFGKELEKLLGRLK